MSKKQIVLISIVSFIGLAVFISALIRKDTKLNEIKEMILCLTAFVNLLIAFINKLPPLSSKQKTAPNLPARNQYFTGRKEKLKDIRRILQTKGEGLSFRTQVITGTGGFGKTEIAREYAHHYRKKYKYIWWVNAETSASVERDYRVFAQINRLESPGDLLETLIAKVNNWMLSKRRWLIIFDNIEDETSLNKYCPSPEREGQHVLVTSRYQLFQHYKTIPVHVFTEAEACEFIEKYTRKPADNYFKELAEKMGYLPLALDQAGAYMKHRPNSSYEKYLNTYNQKNLTLLTKYDGDPEKKTVATTWQISLEKIENPAAKQLLNLCAFLAPDNILTQWFTTASEVLPEELREAVADNTVTDYDDTIAELTRYSIVSLNKEGVLSIHRLVQEVIRDSLKQEQDRWRKYCVDVLNELRYFDFSTAESRTRFLILASHIESVTHGISEKDATEKVANLHLFSGYGYNELGEYGRALEYFMKDLAISEKVLGREHPDTATTYNNIAVVYRAQGEYDQALEYYRKALAIVEKVLGREHPDTATTYNNIAGVYDHKGEYDKALEYYRKDLAISEKVLGREHPDTATTYNNIAGVYRAQGAYDKALEYSRKALAIREKVLGREHPDTATTYNNIALVYRAQGAYDKALEYYRKALAIREKVLGREHPDTATTYNNIAAVYDHKGEYDKALEYNMKALAIREKVLGREHPDTATTYNNIALVYYHKGEYDQALEYYRKALAIREKVLGNGHPYTQGTWNDMADTYEKSGQSAPFEEWLEENL